MTNLLQNRSDIHCYKNMRLILASLILKFNYIFLSNGEINVIMNVSLLNPFFYSLTSVIQLKTCLRF